METLPEITQILIALFILALLTSIVPILMQHIGQTKTPKLAEISLPPDQEAKFNRWFEHFKQEQVRIAARGDKALANPLDDSADGSPNLEELRIFEQMVKSAGYGAHINASIQNPSHLTIYWD